MKTEDLTSFLKLAELQNMHRVAEALNLTQSAVTKSLRRIESELGIKLFRRTATGMELTEAGAVFRKRVGAISLNLHDALNEIAELREGQRGFIRLGLTTACLTRIGSGAIKMFKQMRRMAKFQLTVHTTTTLLKHLGDGDLDLVLGVISDNMPENVAYTVLQEQSTVAVVRNQHPLTHAVKVRDLGEFEWILPPATRLLRQWLEDKFREYGLQPPNVAIETDATGILIVSLIVQSDMVGMMYEDAYRSLSGIGISSLDRLIPPSSHKVGLMWRKASYMSPIVRDFQSLLMDISAF